MTVLQVIGSVGTCLGFYFAVGEVLARRKERREEEEARWEASVWADALKHLNPRKDKPRDG